MTSQNSLRLHNGIETYKNLYVKNLFFLKVIATQNSELVGWIIVFVACSPYFIFITCLGQKSNKGQLFKHLNISHSDTYISKVAIISEDVAISYQCTKSKQIGVLQSESIILVIFHNRKNPVAERGNSHTIVVLRNHHK